jgi:type II secretory pathway pseudopilin PulG
MVELLTVIAIIAILAAIIFPVFATVRRNVYKAQCSSNLHQIGTALKMYRDDWRVYPEALYGYVGQLGEQTFLYPTYINNKNAFRCPLAVNRPDDGQAPMPTKKFSTGDAVNVRFWPWDSYDGTRVPHPNGPYELHYTKKWTPGTVGFRDDPRQLIYRNPPDNTVVTWCTYHRDYAQGEVARGSIDLVLFLDGSVKPIPSDRMLPQGGDLTRPYKVVPTP